MSSDGHGGFPIPITLALIAAAPIYVWNWYRLRSTLPNVMTTGRLAAFIGGTFALWIAVGSPLASLDHELLIFHMLQHLVLMTMVAPLILLGAQGITPHRFSQRVAVSFQHGLFGSPAQRLGRFATHPVFCWFAATVTVLGWHVPAVFELGMQSAMWHAIEQICFFAAGLLFWWPVVQAWPTLANCPRWSVPLYLFLATLPCDALSAFLTFCNRVVYPHYFSAHDFPMQRLFAISPLGDQECAGALMWIWVTFAYLVPAAAVTMQMLSPRRLSSRAEFV